ncbi:MAG: menaquinone biosynthesis decarboxylase [Bacteroidetes bacterium]|nr:menaquinone biosynthesis decarboxylase [Bacteroidota bacterium]
MAYKNLNHFIQCLENAGELVRIKEFVSPHLEIAEITDRISKSGGKALLFENTGTKFPVLINSMGSYKRMCIALGVNNLDEIGNEIEKIFLQLTSSPTSFTDKLRMLPMLSNIASWMPKVKNGKGECQEVINMQPDLSELPVLTCWIHDGGPFITLPVVNTKDPLTGKRNVGMYRMQVFDNNTTGMHWHLHKNSARHYHEYKKLNQRMPVSVVLGGDPAYTYSATAPLPDNVDEYMLAGFLRKQKVELVKCITNDIEVPNDADFVIEGYVDPMEELVIEGPFGDHTGYYSLQDYYPKFHVTCITHRKDAVYPATIVGIPPQEDAYIGKATERIFLTPIRMAMLPEIIDMAMPVEGVFHNIVIVKIKKDYPGHANKVMNALWGAGQMMFNKILIVVDGNTDIHNYSQVLNAIATNVDPGLDIHFSKGAMDVLDHSSTRFAYGSKLGIDATIKLAEEVNAEVDKNLLPQVKAENILQLLPEIKAIKSLHTEGLPFLLLCVEKKRKAVIRKLTAQLLEEGLISAYKAIVWMDTNVNLNNFEDVVWLFANNIDPERDAFFPLKEDGNKHAVLVIDGTRKTLEYDNFKRPWPNVVVVDDATIKAVDEKWGNLGLGELIYSPSLKYKALLFKGGAVAVE